MHWKNILGGMVLVSAISGCSTMGANMADQIIEFPALVSELKSSILIACDCAKLEAVDSTRQQIFYLGSVDLTITTVARKGDSVDSKPKIGVLPIDLGLGYGMSVSAEQTQTIKIALSPLSIGPGPGKISEVEVELADKSKQIWTEADYITVGGKLYLTGQYKGKQGEKDQEIWVDAALVRTVKVTKRESSDKNNAYRFMSGLPIEKLRERCSQKKL